MGLPDADNDGYKDLDGAAMGALYGLFGVTLDGGGNITDPGTLYPLFAAWNVWWGVDVKEGNMAVAFINMGDFEVNNTTGMYDMLGNMELEVWHKPLFPAGRFMLLKNPDSGDDYTYAEGGVNDMGMPSPDMKVSGALEANEANGKKVAIDWEWPLGPAATWGPFFYTYNYERFPLAFPWAPKGVAMENEQCTSCHDGAAGLSTQPAKVYAPAGVTLGTGESSTGTYTVAYSHDSNIRGCARAQWLNPEDGDNFGPHCANCHSGAGACMTCHDDAGENWTAFGRTAFATYDDVTGVYDYQLRSDLSYESTTNIFIEGNSTFQAAASARTLAIATESVGDPCLDGGFSFPHRTLGANMLKDAIYGVDFDGTPVEAGDIRAANGTDAQALVQGDLAADLESFWTSGRSFEASTLVSATVQNLDSVCIDCHGNATTFLGDAAKAEFVSYNPLDGGATSWDIEAWSLLLKGLP
jgi:hypothetical protein